MLSYKFLANDPLHTLPALSHKVIPQLQLFSIIWKCEWTSLPRLVLKVKSGIVL